MRKPSDTAGKLELRTRLEELTARYEHLAGQAKQRTRTMSRTTPVLIASVGIDSVRAAEHHIDLLGDTEFAAAARRVGVENFDVDAATAAQLRGALTALRGAAGEHHVETLLSHQRLPIPAHTDTFELTAFTEPGTDILFKDNAGQIVVRANVKIAGTAEVIRRHFAEHPDVRIIYSSSDAASHAQQLGYHVIFAGQPIPHHGNVVVDIGRSSSTFDHDIADAIADLDGASDRLGELPWMSLGVIGYRLGQRLRRGEDSANALRAAGKDTIKVTVGKGIGAATTAITHSEPTVFLLSSLSTAVSAAIIDVRDSWDEATKELLAVANDADGIIARYDPQHIERPASWRQRLGDLSKRRPNLNPRRLTETVKARTPTSTSSKALVPRRPATGPPRPPGTTGRASGHGFRGQPGGT